LDDIGLSIGEAGADWGDSEIELFLIRQAMGEIPADRHPPNRNVSIPLVVRKEGATKLPDAAAKIQKKIGTWQREGGFLKRVLDPTAGFTTDVAMQVRGASISGLQGWLMAHRQTAPEVVLNLVTGPYFYGVTEVESAEFKIENASQLEWEIANIKGSAPGLCRVQIKNNGATDWKGLLAAMESRDLAAVGTRNTTADIFYECEKLTLAGGSTEVAVGEASSGNVVQNAALSTGFLSVLSSKVVASGHMTHTGPRRVWMRVKDMGAVSENIELKLVWRPLSSAKWSENKAVRIVVSGSFSKVDLGEVIPEAAVLGEQRWEWKLLARTRNIAAGSSVQIDVVYILPIEQMMALNAPPVTLQPENQSSKNPAKGTKISGAWVNPENIKASDNVRATAVMAPKPVGPESSGDIVASEFGFAIPAEAAITGVVVSVERSANFASTVRDSFIMLRKAGVEVGENKALGNAWGTGDEVQTYGGSTDLWGETWTPAQINAATFGVVLTAKLIAAAEGEAKVDLISVTVYYSTSTDENRVCFAGRSIELRSDGVFRQHLTDNVWGRGVPDGFLPYAPPSGLEARAVRGLIVPSRGDHLTQADVGNHKIVAKVFYFPGYHFVSEI
jgi:hypothetical protein